MKERPTLFNGEMVRAILDGRKTQTRRIVRPQPNDAWEYDKFVTEAGCPFGKVGDRLWVRESILITDWRGFRQCKFKYVADDLESDWIDFPFRLKGNEAKLKGKKFPNGCFKEASRITLEITNVRVERLQDISKDDAVKEGIQELPSRRGYYDPTAKEAICIGHYFTDPRDAFLTLWDSVYPKPEQNPWVWVIEFKRLRNER